MRDCNLWLTDEPMAELCKEFGVEETLHGKSDKISQTCLLLKD
jgi:hypothetical protein